LNELHTFLTTRTGRGGKRGGGTKKEKEGKKGRGGQFGGARLRRAPNALL